MIVLGLGFGDEGKGQTVSFLCSKDENASVVRFNGGHQAGHTVIHNRRRHVFSSFGSGTLQGRSTFWSEYCTFYPIAFWNEWNVLSAIEVRPHIVVHPLSPVTTPFDVVANKILEDQGARYGSCGVGFGATLQRNQDHYQLYVKDLFFDSVLSEKLRMIAQYYMQKGFIGVSMADVANFIKVCQIVRKLIIVDTVPTGRSIIYEGAQGILLDQNYGFFPHVTRSNTTCQNAMELGFFPPPQEIMYVTRTYQTRHGLGFMTNENKGGPVLKNAEGETNQHHPYQGSFRKGILDIDLLKYALECDRIHSGPVKRHLMITCVDQTGHEFEVTEGGEAKKCTVNNLPGLLGGFNKVYVRSNTVTSEL